MKFIYGNKTKFYFFSLTTLQSYLFLTPFNFYLTHIFILIFSFLIKKYALYSYYSDKVTIFFFFGKVICFNIIGFPNSIVCQIIYEKSCGWEILHFGMSKNHSDIKTGQRVPVLVCVCVNEDEWERERVLYESN